MYEELVKRLRNCASRTWVEDCDGCPYIRYDGTYCMDGLITDAADAIEKLSAENKKLDETIKRAYLIINSLIPNMEETEHD